MPEVKVLAGNKIYWSIILHFYSIAFVSKLKRPQLGFLRLAQVTMRFDFKKRGSSGSKKCGHSKGMIIIFNENKKDTL